MSLLRQGRVADTYHIQYQGDDACVKILKPELISDRNSVLQFKNEYRALASMKHPAFFTPSNWGEIEGVCCYFTEFHPYQTLQEQLSSEAFSGLDREIVFCKLVDACAYLHEQGMIHFGIKPDNILWNGDDCKVVQLGQVRFDEADLDYPEILITNGFTDPDVISGTSQISKRADVYSLCAVGKALFEGREMSDEIRELISLGSSGQVLDAVQARSILPTQNQVINPRIK